MKGVKRLRHPLRSTDIGTSRVWAMRLVQASVPAMTLHIVIGCNDIIRYHCPFETLTELVMKIEKSVYSRMYVIDIWYNE